MRTPPARLYWTLRSTGVLIAVMAMAVLCAPPARAGSYNIYPCVPGYANNAFAPVGNPAYYALSGDCAEGAVGTGLDVATQKSGGLVPYGHSGAWTMSAPPGATIGQVFWRRYLSRESPTWTVGMFAAGPGQSPLFLDGLAAGDGGGPTQQSWRPRGADAQGRTQLSGGVVCGNESCGLTSADVRARYSITSLNVQIFDGTAPAVSGGGALIVNPWVGGSVPFLYAASDNTGIKVFKLLADSGRYLPVSGENAGPGRIILDGCVYDRPKPCPDRYEPRTANLRELPDGRHRLELRVVDTADNESAAYRDINVDNTPPTPPVGLAVTGGEGWRATNSFDLSWTAPPQLFAPIVAAAYQLCRLPAGAPCLESAQVRRASLSDVRVPAVGQWRIRIALLDAAGNSTYANGADAVLRFDNIPPAAPSFAPTDPNDPTLLTALASDQGSGVTAGQISYRQANGDGQWKTLPTAATAAGLQARIDDRQLRPATYELVAVATDAAGNSTSSDRRDNGSKAQITAPLRIPMRVRLAKRPLRSKRVCRVNRTRNKAGRLVKKRRCRLVALKPPPPLRKLRIAYGNRRRIFGVVTSRDGQPLAGAPVILRAQARRLGAQIQDVATVETDSAGRFSYLARGTQSRTLEAVYPGTATVGYAATQADISVPAQVTLKATPTAVRNGKSTTFTGSLGQPVSEGKIVNLQVIVRGEWRPFKTVRAGANGRFGAPYRFTVTAEPTRYRFRARVPREATYPYDTGTSPTIGVVVRP